MFKFVGFSTLIVSFAVATATDPIGFPWQWSCGLSVVIAAAGSVCDYHTDRFRETGTEPPVVLASVAVLSVIAGLLFFSFFRFYWDDSLQVSVLSGICGIYGRRTMQPLADKIIDKIKA